MIIFDIETGPLPREEILAVLPPFDPESVKVGNRKPETAAAYIAEQAAAYEANAIERAALSPVTGQVLAIGILSLETDKTRILDYAEEVELLIAFWRVYRMAHEQTRRLVGHYILSFDVPFLIRRSWILGVDVPSTVFHGRYLDPLFVDTSDYWGCGFRFTGDSSSLDSIARALGVGSKNGSGKDFASLWMTNRAAALAYLANDLELTAAIAKRMGVV